MQIFHEIEPLRAYLKHKRRVDATIGLVPTMGALHEGHLSLIKAAKSVSGVTVCSLYVNPTQFNNATDLDKYPRTLDHDISLLSSAGCDVLFVPQTQSMYERPGIIRFDFGQLDKILEGKFRPGHFSGVATVVSKLFNIVAPDHAFFGEKDYQQLQIIKRLVEELKFNTDIYPVPTSRELNGLAMSSRNLRLTEDQKRKAAILHQSLSNARERLLAGEQWSAIQTDITNKLSNTSELKLEYFELAHRDDLTRTTDIAKEGVIVVACFVGDVRLIDNMLVTPTDPLIYERWSGV